MLNAALSDFSGKDRAESIPPEPHRLVADIDATLEEQILDLPKRQRIADVHHHRETDHLG
jgi:hypothetical protein